MMRILIGIVDDHPGWQLLLSQEGIPYRCIRSGDEVAECSVLVGGDGYPESLVPAVRDFLKGGGGILCAASLLGRLSGVPPRERTLTSILPEAGSFLSGIGLCDLFLTARIPAQANVGMDRTGHPTVFCGDFGGGFVVAFPFDPAAAILDGRLMTKSFYSERRRLPYETVPAVTKGSIRQFVARGLEYLHHACGLPYAHLWYYPENARSIAAFRIDTDFGTEREIEELYALSERLSKPFTWFVDVASQEQILPVYRGMRLLEIGVHCNTHKHYKGAGDASADLGRAITALERNQIEAHGCALPFGQWSTDLGREVERRGFKYSSEFSYDADNSPSFPYLATRFSNTLQIPVHPISIGNLNRQGFQKEEIVRYYRYIIDLKMQSREPIVLYHHPKNGRTDIIDAFLRTLREPMVRWMTFSDYSNWWRERNAGEPSVNYDNRQFHFQLKKNVAGMLFHVTMEDGTESYCAPAEAVERRSLRWQPKPEPFVTPPDLLRIRNFNPWIPLQRCEDFLRQCWTVRYEGN